MSVEVVVKMQVNASETLTSGVDAVDDPTLRIDGFNSSHVLNAATEPAATRTYSATVALVAGAKTIDLTALTAPGGVSFSASGLKLQVLKLTNNGSAPMTFQKGASNGYLLFMNTAGLIELGSGDECLFYFNDSLADIDGTHKTIDVAGSSTHEFDIMAIFG